MKKHIFCRLYIHIGGNRIHMRDFKYTVVDDSFMQQRKIDRMLVRLEQVIKAALDFSIVLGVFYIVEVELLIDDITSPVHHRYGVYNPATVLGFTKENVKINGLSQKAAHRISEANALEAYRVAHVNIRRDVYKRFPPLILQVE